MQYKVAFTGTQTPLPTNSPPAAGVAVSVTDRSGAVLPPVILTGSESPPWTTSITGADGPGKASVILTALDVSGNTLGAPLPIQESAGGGAGTFLQPTSGTLTVTA